MIDVVDIYVVLLKRNKRTGLFGDRSNISTAVGLLAIEKALIKQMTVIIVYFHLHVHRARSIKLVNVEFFFSQLDVK